MIKKKISLFLAVLMISTITAGINVKPVYAADDIKIEAVHTNNLKDGEYTVKNMTSYVDESNSTGQDMARNVVSEDSIIKVENGVIKMTVKFNNSMYKFLKNINVTLNGQTLPSEINAAEKSITFQLPSIDSKVVMNMNVSIMNKNVSFYLENDINTLKLANESEIDKDNNDKVEDSNDKAEDNNDKVQDGNNSEQNLKDGNYVLNNDVQYYKEGASKQEIETGYSAARGVLNAETGVAVQDGKIRMTLSFNEEMYSFLQNIRVSLDGSELNSVIDQNARTLSFDVPSLDSKVLLSMKVTVMQRDVSFHVINDISTLKNIDNNESKDEIVESGNNGAQGNGQTVPGINNSEVIEKTEVPEETQVKEKVTIKEYTIKNNVTHESATGVSMARKYLNDTSYVKEVNGKYYVTFSFTGKEFMNGHKIYVNGRLAETTVLSSDSDSISLRFEVSSLNDNIKVSTYVVPMSRNVEFGVQLLTNTLTLVKEYTVAPEEVAGDLTLPSTGDFTSMALPVLGLVTAGAGTILTRKRK